MAMTSREAAISWPLFGVNWIPLGLLAVALGASLALTDFSIGFGGAAVSTVFVASYAAVAQYNAKAPHRQDPQIVFALGATAQIVLLTMLATPLTYVAASFSFPLQDANLFAIDRALGIDGRAYLAFVNDHPLLASWLHSGYGMIRWPIFAIPVILAAARRYRRLQEFILAFTLALTVTTVISAFVPALGIFSLLGEGAAAYPNVSAPAYAESLREMPQVRDGSLRHLELLGLKGLVTFPSFHTASAVLYLWALWPVRWFRPIAVAANILMIASCPVDGAHYFIDLAAGIAVAVLAIAAARQVSRWVAARVGEEAAHGASYESARLSACPTSQ
jgi:hypothetical protein